MSTDGGGLKVNIITRVVDGVLQRPFTEAMALVTTITLIALGYYELKIGRPELLQQINAGHHEAHQRFDANLERVLQADDKRTDLFKELIERNDGFIHNGNAAIQTPNEKAGS